MWQNKTFSSGSSSLEIATTLYILRTYKHKYTTNHTELTSLSLFSRSISAPTWQTLTGTSVLHRFPFSVIHYFCYKHTLDYLQEFQSSVEISSSNPTKISRFTAGAVAGSTVCICCYPLDLLQTRLTTELPSREHYRGITDAVRKILGTEGVRGLYSGLGAPCNGRAGNTLKYVRLLNYWV